MNINNSNSVLKNFNPAYNAPKVVTEKELIQALRTMPSQKFKQFVRQSQYQGVSENLLQIMLREFTFDINFIKEVIESSSENVFTVKLVLTACTYQKEEFIEYILPKMNGVDFAEHELVQLIESTHYLQCFQAVEKFILSLPESKITPQLLLKYPAKSAANQQKLQLLLEKAPVSSITEEILLYLLRISDNQRNLMAILRKAPNESFIGPVLSQIVSRYATKMQPEELKELFLKAPTTSFTEQVYLDIIQHKCLYLFSCIDAKTLANASEQVQMKYLYQDQYLTANKICELLCTFPNITEKVLLKFTGQFGNDPNILQNIFDHAPKSSLTEQVLLDIVQKFTTLDSLKRNIILKNAPESSLTMRFIGSMIYKNKQFTYADLNILLSRVQSLHDAKDILKVIKIVK